jgi:3-oxocholest-4-en-26-oyl-CoA dehydrogenase beta subunit
MDWSFTEEQDQLAALTRQILEENLSEERMREIEAREDRFDEQLWKLLKDAGILDVRSYDLVGWCRVLIEVGRTVAPVPVLPATVASFFVDDERLVVPAIVGLRDGSGVKTTVAGGTIAGAFLEAHGGTLKLFGADDVGVERQVVTDLSSEARVTFAGAEPELVIDGAAEHLVRLYTLGLCAVQLGVCERALELTAEYSKQRVQFDRPIATFQAVGQRLADAYIDVNAIRLTLWQAAYRLAEGLDCETEVAVAKFWAADAGHRVAHTAVHVHGGMGIDLDYHLNRYFVAAKRIEFALGGATEQLVRIGQALAEEPA